MNLVNLLTEANNFSLVVNGASPVTLTHLGRSFTHWGFAHDDSTKQNATRCEQLHVVFSWGGGIPKVWDGRGRFGPDFPQEQIDVLLAPLISWHPGFVHLWPGSERVSSQSSGGLHFTINHEIS